MRRWSVWLLWKKLHDCRRADAEQVEGATCQDKVQQLVITPGLRTVSAWSRRAHEHQSVGTAQPFSLVLTQTQDSSTLELLAENGSTFITSCLVHYSASLWFARFLWQMLFPTSPAGCVVYTLVWVCKPLHSILLAAEKRCGHHGATCWFMNRRVSGSGVLH